MVSKSSRNPPPTGSASVPPLNPSIWRRQNQREGQNPVTIENADAGSSKTGPDGLFVVGGVVKSVIAGSDTTAVRDHLSSLLQVQNLVILLGSGASFHLGSPQTRNLTNHQVLEIIQKSGISPTVKDGELLATINPGDKGDLEKLLNGLQLAASLASQANQTSIALGTGENIKSYSTEEINGLRQRINYALSQACELPSADQPLDAPYDNDPLLAHRTFLSRMVQSRGANLPRPRIFTTNYDLVIERALDELGYPYIDGFSGTVDRRLNLAFYGLDFHRVETTTQSVLSRTDGVLYLHKVHGSLNWRPSNTIDRNTGLQSLEVKQSSSARANDDLVLIYPTSSKEGDTLAYPYSDLLRLLSDAVQQDDTAVIVAGYGFADAHINRILLRTLATNSALSILVADPFAVLDEGDWHKLNTEAQQRMLNELDVTPKKTAIAALASTNDSRVAVLTGNCGKFTELAQLMPCLLYTSDAADDAPRV